MNSFLLNKSFKSETISIVGDQSDLQAEFQYPRVCVLVTQSTLDVT